MKERKRNKLSVKLLLGLTAFSIFSLALILLFVGYDYYTTGKTIYTNGAFSFARAASRFIDGDRVEDYLNVVGADEDGRPVYFTDGYYDEVMAFLSALQSENSVMKYYYVVIPREDGFIYIWDAETAENASPQGTFEAYGSVSREVITGAFSRDPRQAVAVYRDRNWGDIARACYPVFDSDGDPVAVVGVDLSVEGMVLSLLHYFRLIVPTVLVATALAAAVGYVLIDRALIRPIGQLNAAAKCLVEGLDSGARADLEIGTNDELEELAGSFRKMDGDLRQYIEKLSIATADREHVHAQFEIARQLQADILPGAFPAFPDRRDFDVFAANEPCERICGDFYDFFLIDDDHLALAAGDVSDQGVPAALYMVMVVTLLRSRVRQGRALSDVLEGVSEQLLKNRLGSFCTVWFAVLELSTGEGVAVNAGYQHPALCRAGESFELQRYSHFPPIGAVEGVRYRDHGFRLRPGDTLFVYSDGVRDAVNGETETFGSDRVLQALNRQPEATPGVLLQTVRQEIRRFAGDAPRSDDRTMLCLKYYGPEGGGAG